MTLLIPHITVTIIDNKTNKGETKSFKKISHLLKFVIKTQYTNYAHHSAQLTHRELASYWTM